MKKMKLLKSIVATSALVVPIMTVLATATSCNKVNYFSIAKKFKATALEEFINLSHCRRHTWQEQQMFTFLKERMKVLGYEPAGYDYYGKNEYVQKAAIQDLGVAKYDQNLAEYGNLWYDIPATEGCEDWPKIILHAHQDAQMVFKDAAAEAEWKQNGVDVYYDQDQQIMYSNGYKCTLGADCGIGCAELLSIAVHAKDSDFKHGPIRLLFSCDESGAVNYIIDEKTRVDFQSGASYLYLDQLYLETPKETWPKWFSADENGKKPFDTNFVIDLDGYQQSHIMRSCAGIHECIYNYDNYDYESIVPKEKTKEEFWRDDSTEKHPHEWEITVNITRPQGANSGSDVNKGYANALKILAQTIIEWDEDPGVKPTDQIFRLISASCEGSAYAICPSAKARFVSYLDETRMQNKIDEFIELYEASYPKERGKIKISKEEIKGFTGERCHSERALTKILTPDKQKVAFDPSLNILALINILEFGPVTWFDAAKTKVKTSYNVGPLTVVQNEKDPEKASVNFHVVSRSTDDVQQEIFTKRIHNYVHYFLEVDPTGNILTDVENDSWASDENNKMTKFIYDIEKGFKYNPEMDDIHSWSEISEFPRIMKLSGYDQAHMASIGTTITGVHSRQETFYVSTMDSLLKTLIFALMNANKLK